MSVTLVKLAALGPEKAEAIIEFGPSKALIRGPSDTGKSYIRDCLWYLLGGDKVPKTFPEAEGYDALELTLLSGDQLYAVSRGLSGGIAAVARCNPGQDGKSKRESLDVEVGEWLVSLAGAQDRHILRSRSSKGPVTGGDLRHWFLLSQPNIISETPPSGENASNVPQRVAAFNLFLTGNDDEAVELAKSAKELQHISGQLQVIETTLTRMAASIPWDLSRADVEQAIERVDETLSSVSRQYNARAAQLREVRAAILSSSDMLRRSSIARDHSAMMVERFELLNKKYESDLERLGATSEGVAMFESLPDAPCPLCGTPSEHHVDPQYLKAATQDRYRQALAAEVQKIRALQTGLLTSLKREKARVEQLELEVASAQNSLRQLERREVEELKQSRLEFSADPKVLAVRRGELVSQMAVFDEIQRLTKELDVLKKSHSQKRIPLKRPVTSDAVRVGDYAKDLIVEWGFKDTQQVELDPTKCDLVIDRRDRLSYGAGKRALFLAAMTIAMLRHGMETGRPHLGVVVIDSPLKAYADPTSKEGRNVPVATVTEKFYTWLSKWDGPGQIVILENEKVPPGIENTLDATEFTGAQGAGRSGFYPT